MISEAMRLLRAGHPEAALALLQPALERDAAVPELLKAGINAAMACGRIDLGWSWFQALRAQGSLDPALARVGSKLANRRGTELERDGQGEPALELYRHALDLWPENDDARVNSIRILCALADPRLLDLAANTLPADSTEWVTTLQAALRGEPVSDRDSSDNPDAPIATLIERRERHTADRPFVQTGSLAHRLAETLALPMVYRDRADLVAWRSRYGSGLDHLVSSVPTPKPDREGLKQIAWSNFLLAYQGQNDLALQSRYGDWLSGIAAALRPDLAAPRNARRAGTPRIGLVSGHWYRRTVGSYFASWIDALAVADLTVDVLALAPNLDDFTDSLGTNRARLLRLDADPDRAAETIHAGDYDLLIYPELGIDTRLLPLAALPLGRQQWLAWGHPVTSGLPTMSAYLTPAAMEPPDAIHHYRERLLTLPGIGTAYRAPDPVPAIARAELGLPSGPLLVCPQSPFKIHPDQDELLAEALAAVPHSRLLLFASERPLALAKLRARLARSFVERHVDPARLMVHPMVPRARFLEILGTADLMLDTRHWSGGNTALDALFMGLPLVAVESAFMRGRQSAAMLRLIGLDAAIAVDGSGFGDRVRSVLDAGRTPWAGAFAALANGHGAPAALREHVLAGLA